MLKKLSGSDYRVSAWSGGTTTQLLIAPEEAVYGDRTFLWRVSSATVELDESEFTPLPDYDRIIATLSGEIRLRHNGEEPILLQPYQIHSFSGGDRTVSRGRCIDFNLMLRRGKAVGTMEALLLPEAGCSIGLERPGQMLIYCAQGACAASVSASSVSEASQPVLRLEPGETLLQQGPEKVTLLPMAPETRVMVCRMHPVVDSEDNRPRV